MGKRKQKGKLMTMADRERLRLQTNLVGLENQHVATGDIGNENVRQLCGRNVPIPIPPLGIPPEAPKNKVPPHPDSTESFDLGISLPTPPYCPGTFNVTEGSDSNGNSTKYYQYTGFYPN